MLDRFTSMSVFVSAVDQGSFTDAATACGMSATMVGKHIRALEQRLGAKLLSRTTRQQSLTEVGRLYYERCRQLLEDLRQADASADDIRTSPRGLLRIHAPVSFGSQRLAGAIASYLQRYPETRIDLSLYDRHSDRPIDLVEEGYDAAILIGPLADSNLVARPLQPYRMWLCAAPAYLKRAGTPRQPQDLAQHNCLAFSHWRRKNLWRFHEQRNRQDVQVDGQLIANNGQALKAAAIAGLGIIMQPEILLAEDVAAGRLVRLLADHQPALRPLYIVHRAGRSPTAKLRNFVDFIVEQFG